jgi:hypothetical protein
MVYITVTEHAKDKKEINEDIEVDIGPNKVRNKNRGGTILNSERSAINSGGG